MKRLRDLVVPDAALSYGGLGDDVIHDGPSELVHAVDCDLDEDCTCWVANRPPLAGNEDRPTL